MLIAKCQVTGAAADPDYRQAIRCGRHEMLADERPARGGADAGPMPFEYVLSGLGTCTSITLRMYAQRKGWQLGEVDVSLTLHRRDDQFEVERRVRLSAALSEEQRTKLAEICEKTPVTLAVKAGMKIQTAVEAQT